jgi:hypothetical protein
LASDRYEKEAPGFNLLISVTALSKVIVVLSYWVTEVGCQSWWGDPSGELTRAVTQNGILQAIVFALRCFSANAS